MTHRLQGVMEKWETANANEKILLSTEMNKLKDTLHDRERRMNYEIQQLRKEKDELFLKITSIDPEADHGAQLQLLLKELKQGEESRSKSLAKENAQLVDVTKELSSKLVTETSKDKVKLNKKPVDKMPVKKAMYLIPSKQVESVLNGKKGKK